MMDAELQKAIVDYEQGQTYPAGSKERADYLAKGLKQFEEIYKNYRTQWAGLTARMWQGKCYEEAGEYRQSPGHLQRADRPPRPAVPAAPAPRRLLQDHRPRKRKEYPLAADESVRWLQQFSSTDEKHSREGLGVQLELAKNILAQLTDATKAAERDDGDQARRRGAHRGRPLLLAVQVRSDRDCSRSTSPGSHSTP